MQVTCCGLTIEGQTMVDIAVIDTGVPEVITFGIVTAEGLLDIRLKGFVQMRVNGGKAGMETGTFPMQVATGSKLIDVVLAVHLRYCAMIT